MATFGSRAHDGTNWVNGSVDIILEATENWTNTTRGCRQRFVTTPNTTATARNSMILQGDGILEVDANADGDVIRIKQGGTQEGAITVSGTTVAYTTFCGAHPSEFKGEQNPPRGAVLVSTGKVISNNREEDDSQRFTYVSGTTQVLDKTV